MTPLKLLIIQHLILKLLHLSLIRQQRQVHRLPFRVDARLQDVQRHILWFRHNILHAGCSASRPGYHFGFHFQRVPWILILFPRPPSPILLLRLLLHNLRLPSPRPLVAKLLEEVRLAASLLSNFNFVSCCHVLDLLVFCNLSIFVPLWRLISSQREDGADDDGLFLLILLLLLFLPFVNLVHGVVNFVAAAGTRDLLGSAGVAVLFLPPRCSIVCFFALVGRLGIILMGNLRVNLLR